MNINPYSVSVPRVRGPFYRNFQNDPIPPVWKGIFTYTSMGVSTGGTAGVMGTDYVFRLNSCYDPDQTGTGRQPYAWDQVSPLYQQYLVTDVDIEIEAFDPSEDGMAFVAMILPSASGATMAGNTVEVCAERPMCVCKLLSNTGSQKATIRQRLDLSQLDGITRLQLQTNQGQYGAAIGSSPSLSPLLRIGVGSLRSSNGPTMCWRVTLKFHTQLFERIVWASS